MLQTPLHSQHLALGAKMVPFAGYSMPVSYSSVKEEYFAIRQNCGIFDISHMTPMILTPPPNSEKDCDDVKNFLNFITCRKVEDIAVGQVQYNALINEQGGIVDDITIYNIDNREYRLIVNASNRQPVIEHIQNYLAQKNSSIQLTLPQDYVLVALQGPKSSGVLQKYLEQKNIVSKEIYYYEFFHFKIGGFEAMISRTGYTGEDGFEILLPQKEGLDFWQFCLDNNAACCGLAARDLLRLEMFYPLYGNELSMQQTPLQAGLSFIVNLDKDFLGKSFVAEHKQKLPGRNRGFMLEEEGVPRSHYKIVQQQGRQVGEVTSGSFSFSFNKGFGIAYIDEETYQSKQPLFVEIRGALKKIKILNKSPLKGSVQRRP